MTSGQRHVTCERISELIFREAAEVPVDESRRYGFRVGPIDGGLPVVSRNECRFACDTRARAGSLSNSLPGFKIPGKSSIEITNCRDKISSGTDACVHCADGADAKSACEFSPRNEAFPNTKGSVGH